MNPHEVRKPEFLIRKSGIQVKDVRAVLPLQRFGADCIGVGAVARSIIRADANRISLVVRQAGILIGRDSRFFKAIVAFLKTVIRVAKC